jgi:hypothetical protein
MLPDVAAVMANQHGLVLRRQALSAGMSGDEISRLLRHGEWVAVRRGVYTTRSLWEGLEPHREQPLLEVRAASLNMVMPHVISHDSAALLQGLEILEARPRLVHVTRFGVLGGRIKSGVKQHKAPFTPEQIVFVDGLPALDVPRTVADISREHGLRHGLPVGDSAMRAGVSREALREPIVAMRSWPGVTVPREVAELADPGAENVAESLTRLLPHELGLGPVETQFGLRDGGREARCDIRVGRHIIEFDGRVKYRSVADGGFAETSVEEVLWHEKQRQDWVCGFKLGMSRVVWAELMPDRWERTKRRILREYLDTVARFGSSIDDLAPYVVRRQR